MYARVSFYKEWIEGKISACGGENPDADKCGYDQAGYEEARKEKAQGTQQDTNDIDIGFDGDFNDTMGIDFDGDFNDTMGMDSNDFNITFTVY